MVFITLALFISTVFNTAVDPLCMEFNTAGTACLMCYKSYPSSTGVCTAPTGTVPPNALSYTNGTTIASCNNGYFLLNNTCVAVPNSNLNCANGSANSSGVFTCSACTTGFYLSPYSNCVAIPTANTNCSNGSATTLGVFTCSTCVSGYYLVSGVCTVIPSSNT
jgi:hypothetical protein